MNELEIRALHDACRKYNLDSHIKEISKKSDCNTVAERIAYTHNPTMKYCKNGFLYLNAVDFCFYYNNGFDFAISGNISGKDKNKIIDAITIALNVCDCANKLLREYEND